MSSGWACNARTRSGDAMGGLHERTSGSFRRGHLHVPWFTARRPTRQGPTLLPVGSGKQTRPARPEGGGVCFPNPTKSTPPAPGRLVFGKSEENVLACARQPV